jgi:hypothetical protein
MAGKGTGRGKDGEPPPLRTERSKSLAVSAADRERPTAFMMKDVLAIDALAPFIPFEKPTERDEAITMTRLAIARAMNASIRAAGRKRGLVESRLRLAELLPHLRAKVDSLNTPDTAALVMQIATAVDRVQERADTEQPIPSPEPLWAFLMAADGSGQAGVKAWLDEVERFASEGRSGLTGRPGNYGRLQAYGFIRSLALWWERNTGNLPPKTREKSRPGSQGSGLVHFFDFLEAARSDAGLRGVSLSRAVRAVIEAIELERR